MNSEQPSPARLLAPIGLAVLAVIVVVVIATSLGGDNGDRGGRAGSQGAKAKTQEKFYVVEPGDSLTTIADKTGVSVERLTRLNPNLDPQALISGQRVKLR